MIENVQKKFTRFLFYKKLVDSDEFHYQPIWDSLGWRTLSSRRCCNDMSMLLRIMFHQFPGVSIDRHLRRINVHNLRAQRMLEPLIGSKSNLNRFVEKFNELDLDYSQLVGGNYNNSLRIVYNSVPKF